MSGRIIPTTLLLTVTLVSCRTWTPMEQVAGPFPERIRVELVSGERVELRGARIEADTLVARRVARAERVRLAVDEIASIEAGGISGARTAWAVIGGALVVFSVVTIATFSLG